MTALAPLVSSVLIALFSLANNATVVDQTGALTAAERSTISTRLRALRTRTGAQMVVLLVKSTYGEPLADFSQRLAGSLSRGQQGRDDQLLLTLAITDGTERLDVGAGLKHKIPDAMALSILDSVKVSLRQQQYPVAIHKILEQISTQLNNTAQAPLAVFSFRSSELPTHGGLYQPEAYPTRPRVPQKGYLDSIELADWEWIFALAAAIFGYALGEWLWRSREFSTKLAIFCVYFMIAGSIPFLLSNDRLVLMLVCLLFLGLTNMYARTSGLSLGGYFVALFAMLLCLCLAYCFGNDDRRESIHIPVIAFVHWWTTRIITEQFDFDLLTDSSREVLFWPPGTFAREDNEGGWGGDDS